MGEADFGAGASLLAAFLASFSAIYMVASLGFLRLLTGLFVADKLGCRVDSRVSIRMKGVRSFAFGIAESHFREKFEITYPCEAGFQEQFAGDFQR